MTTTRGKHFIQSLKDGRSVWLNGEKIEDITTHPAFTGTLRTLEKLFNMLDEPGMREKIGFRSPKTGEYVHNAFLIPTAPEHLKQRKEAFKIWADATFGVMSRLSEFGRTLITSWHATSEMFRQYDERYPEKIRRFYEIARDEDRFVIQAFGNPQIDRSKDAAGASDPDAHLRIVRETSEGIYIKGAKTVATGAPYAHDLIIAPNYRVKDTHPEYAHALIVPLNAQGIHIICRESYASTDIDEHPLSAQFDEMDAVIVFDNVFIPWDRVLLHGNPEAVWKFYNTLKSNALTFHQTVVRLVSKLEFITGLGIALAESIGVDSFLNVQEKLGELIVQVESIKGLLHASEIVTQKDQFGMLTPSPIPLQTARNLGMRYYPRAIEILQQIGAGGYTQTPSTTVENSGEIRAYLETYYRGAAVSASQKIKLFKVAWDIVGSPLGSRHELYERLYAGEASRMYALQYLASDKTALEKRLERFWTITEERRNEP
ncbi:4-hydroxyphenylacetate 3-hydroxylase family protein [Paenibacillus naphthalenovorans]|uniref:4-hydroxyphenylacetate 3-hydroxylase family protein n=1 Tax=Paenibacillus naphthalenovorans TaxID=162209 RepID=UPI000884DACB|nr:4-hydroxyphenylacetate 3-hydroxylase N-terminal domain-containing protein [Paenibacillus naphthalenovorans]SDJ33758.1 4-hydroxyphenylacetate 3-monooxygenase [Paenibacillus naphthalenovorans]